MHEHDQTMQIVFVSAVSKEFGMYRTPIDEGVSSLDVHVYTQEKMGGTSGSALLRLDEYIQQSDLIVHLIGDRAGAVPDLIQTKRLLEKHPGLHDMLGPDIENEQITYTQWEAYLALFHGKQRDKKLVIGQAEDGAIRDEKHATADYSLGKEEERASQEVHVARLKRIAGVHPAFKFQDIQSFKVGLYETEEWRNLLANATPRFIPDLAKLPQTFADELLGRDEEMARLRTYWEDDGINIAALDAMGGAGKTALAGHFSRGLINGSKAVTKSDDVAAAYAWSFYSQGSNEDRQTSAEEFFVGAYKYFRLGEVPKEAGAKAEPLARAIQRQKTLLILDGLEPLQYATGGRSGGGKSDKGWVGGIKDPDMERLLDLLADSNPGLVLVTTRIALSRLAGRPTVKREALSPLGMMDGITLLRNLGVEPRHEGKPLPPRAAFPAAIAQNLPKAYDAPPATATVETVPYSVACDLAKAVDDLRGHALALTLAGRFLATAHGGDIRHIDMLPSTAELAQALGDLEGYDDESRDYRDTFKVMHAIEIAAARMIDDQQATHDPASTAAGVELAALFFLGLFDRPADATLLDVVYPAAGALEPDPADLQQAATPCVEDPQKPSAPERRERAGRWAAMQSAVTRLFGAAQESETPQAGERPLTEQEADDIREARRRVLLRRLFAGFSALDDKGKRTVSIESIRNALGRLERRGLVAKIDEKRAWEKTAIDCHPLVREYFGLRLKRLDPAAYRAAHSRLYDHLRFVGLPEAFQEPVAYGLLCYNASFPENPLKQRVDDILNGRATPENAPNIPPSLFAAEPDLLRAAAALIDGPDWAAARAAFLPDDAAGMEPLFAAIRHGCEAEREDECFNEVYWPRVARGNENFATHKLGLYGPELAALASFFAQPFDTPSPRLSEARRALVLSNAGFRLRAVGRLEDAVKPYQTVVGKREALQDWDNAGSCAETLSELLLVLGRVAEARTVAAQALTYARRVEQRDRALFRRMASQVRLLPAAQAAGDLPAAEAAQLAAEALQAERQPELPRLYSLQGFLTAELLRARGRTAEAAARAEWTLFLQTRAKEASLLDQGLDQTTAARAALAAAVGLIDRGPLAAPDPALATAAEDALAALRRAAEDPHIPRVLLATAEVRWRVGQLDASQELLRECEDRVVRGPMPLFHADLHLLRARMALSAGRNDDAGTWRARAAELIETYSYGGARPELALLTAEIDPTDDNIRLAARAIRGDATIPQTEEHGFGDGWWGLLPRFRALAEARHPHFAQTLADLETAAEAYTTARDAWLKKNGGIPKPGEAPSVSPEDITDDMVAAALQNEGMREVLEGLLKSTGYDGVLDQAPPDMLKPYIAAIIQQAQNDQTKPEQPDMDDITPDQISDDIVAAALADDGMREALSRVIRETEGIDQPLDQIPRETVRAAFATIATMEQRERQQSQQNRQIPDEVVAAVFANPEADNLLRDVMHQNSLDGEPQDLPDTTKRQIVEMLVEKGVISFTKDEAS